MKNAIICFYDSRFSWIKKYVSNVVNINIVDIVPSPYSVLALEDRMLLMPNAQSDDYDTVVLLGNDSVDVTYAYDEVCRHIKNHKNILSFYAFDANRRELIVKEAQKSKVELSFSSTPEHCFLDTTEAKPVIVISGLNEYTNQFETHLAMNKAMNELGIKSLNITNSKYGLLYGFWDVCNLIDDTKIGNVEELIVQLKMKIEELLSADNYDIIVFSDIYGVEPYNKYLRNQYGIYNYIMKYAVSYDCLLVNLYAKKYRQEEIDQIKQIVANETGTSNVTVGLSHYFENMLEIRDDIFKKGYLLSDADYNNIFTYMKGSLSTEMIDTTNVEALKKYILALYE